jgi:hypothetical protein
MACSVAELEMSCCLVNLKGMYTTVGLSLLNVIHQTVILSELYRIVCCAARNVPKRVRNVAKRTGLYSILSELYRIVCCAARNVPKRVRNVAKRTGLYSILSELYRIVCCAFKMI